MASSAATARSEKGSRHVLILWHHHLEPFDRSLRPSTPGRQIEQGGHVVRVGEIGSRGVAERIDVRRSLGSGS